MDELPAVPAGLDPEDRRARGPEPVVAGASSGRGLTGTEATARATARAATNPQPSAMGEPGPVLTSTSLSNTADMLGARPGRARVLAAGRARDLADPADGLSGNYKLNR